MNKFPQLEELIYKFFCNKNSLLKDWLESEKEEVKYKQQFKNKYDLYSNNISGMKIDLLKNFRSRSEVLNNINLLFDYVMDDFLGGADYIRSHRMVFGNESYIHEGLTDQNYNINIFTYFI